MSRKSSNLFHPEIQNQKSNVTKVKAYVPKTSIEERLRYVQHINKQESNSQKFFAFTSYLLYICEERTIMQQIRPGINNSLCSYNFLGKTLIIDCKKVISMSENTTMIGKGILGTSRIGNLALHERKNTATGSPSL